MLIALVVAARGSSALAVVARGSRTSRRSAHGEPHSERLGEQLAADLAERIRDSVRRGRRHERSGQRVGPKLEELLERIAADGSAVVAFRQLAEEVAPDVASRRPTAGSNRQGYEAELEREIARARRTGRPLSLVLLDVDQPTPDRVLQLAALLTRVTRVTDTVCRRRRDAFGILLPETGEDGARRFLRPADRRGRADIRSRRTHDVHDRHRRVAGQRDRGYPRRARPSGDRGSIRSSGRRTQLIARAQRHSVYTWSASRSVSTVRRGASFEDSYPDRVIRARGTRGGTECWRYRQRRSSPSWRSAPRPRSGRSSFSGASLPTVRSRASSWSEPSTRCGSRWTRSRRTSRRRSSAPSGRTAGTVSSESSAARSISPSSWIACSTRRWRYRGSTRRWSSSRARESRRPSSRARCPRRRRRSLRRPGLRARSPERSPLPIGTAATARRRTRIGSAAGSSSP